MEKDFDFLSPKKKKRKRDASTPTSSQFWKVSDGDMAMLAKSFIPLNIKKNTEWALACFREWRSSKNVVELMEEDQRCPEDLLE